MKGLRPVDRLVVGVALDNATDSYSSKPAHVSPEFNNVIAAGVGRLSGPTLCCAQLGLSLVLTASVGERRQKLGWDSRTRRGLCRRCGDGQHEYGQDKSEAHETATALTSY